MNPKEQDGQGEHGQDDDQRGAKQIAGKLLPLAEEFFFFVVHFLRDVHEVGGGRDVFAAQAKLSRFVQRSGPAQLDGSVQQFQTAKNIVFQLDAQSLLNGIVLGEIANLDQHLVSLGFRAAVGSKIGGVTRIQETGARAGGIRKGGLKVAQRQPYVVAMSDPFIGVQETNDGNRGGNRADHEKNQSGDKSKARFFSR